MANFKDVSDETKQIKEGSRFTTIFSAERVFRVGAVQALGIIFTTFVAGFAGSLVVRFNTAVSLPGRVDANEKDITILKANDLEDAKIYVNQQVYLSDINAIKQSVAGIKESVDALVKLHLNNLSIK